MKIFDSIRVNVLTCSRLSEKSFVLFIQYRNFGARSAASRPKQRILRGLTYSTLKCLIDQLQKETDINDLKRTNRSHHQRDLGTRRTIKKVIRDLAGICFPRPLLLLSPACFFFFFCLFVFSTVTIILIMKILERASNESFLSQFQTVGLL